MAKEKWIGKIVKFKSGNIGMVLESKTFNKTVFLDVLITGQGIINIRAENVEIL